MRELLHSIVFNTICSAKDAPWVFLFFWSVNYLIFYPTLRNNMLNAGALKILPLEERTLPELVQRIGQCSLFSPGLFCAPDYTKDSSNESFGRDLANWFFHVKELCWLKKDTAGKLYLAGRIILRIMLYLYLPFLILALFKITLPLQKLADAAFIVQLILVVLWLSAGDADKRYPTRDVVDEWFRTPKKKRKRPVKRRKHGRGK